MCAAKGPSFDAPACSIRRRLTRTLSAIALLAGIAAVGPGCGSPANIAQAADALQTTLASMPGVSDAWVYHDDSYAQGVAVNIAVDVSNATREQIADVADRIDATQIADDTERLRQIATGTDGRIDWFRSDDGTINQLAFSQTDEAGTAILDAVRNAVGGTALSVSVSPVAASRQTPQMMVNFPLDAAEQTSVFNLVNAIPADVVGLRFDAAGLEVLEVVAHDPATAEQDLSTVITASDAVSARPMWLAWYLPTFAGGAPSYGGMLQISDCSQEPAAAIRPVADHANDHGVSTLQLQLQSKLDTCSAPASAPLPIQSPSTSTATPGQTPPVTPVTDAVTPNRLRDASEPAGLPQPSRSPCAGTSAVPGFGATRCATTSTIAASSGGGQPAPSPSNDGIVPRTVISPPPPTNLGVPRSAASVIPGTGSGSGTSTGARTGTGTGSSTGSTGSKSSHPGR